MTGLDDLYQDLILDHKRSPRNCRRIEDATGSAVGHNPLCGDRLVVYLVLAGDVVQDVSFEGTGCAISVASASLMTERLRGMTVDEAKALAKQMHVFLTEEQAAGSPPDLGKLEALGGVKRYPVRVKCATLCWHTLDAAFAGGQPVVSTEEAS